MEQSIPILSEHQAAPKVDSTDPVGYTPSVEEKKALKLVQKLFEKSKNHRKKYDESWLDNYKFFRGKQWKENRPAYRHSEVINLVFQAIQSMVPIMTDSRPRLEFLPEDPSNHELADILNELAESDWERSNWLYTLTEILYDSHIYGTGLGCMEYDPKARDGIGAIEFKSSDIFYNYPDPSAPNVNDKKSKYWLYVEPVDVDVLKAEYPDKAQFIKPDVVDLMQGDKTDLSQVRFKSPVETKTIIEGSSAYDLASKDQAVRFTLYIKDTEFEEEELKEIDPATGQEVIKYQQKLKYPNGRKIVVVNNIVCFDGSNPYEDGRFPYARLQNYILPREFYGISEIEQLQSPQKIFNKLISFTLDVLTLMGNPIWVVDSTANIDTDNLFNRPGLVVEKEPGSEVRREEGVQLQPYVLQVVDRLRSWFDQVSGATDITRGVRPEGVNSGVAIQSLQDAAQTRIRQKSRNLDGFLQELGQLYLSRVFQFYTVPQVIRITKNQNAAKYFKFHIDTVMDEQTGEEQKIARVRDFKQDVDGNTVMSDERVYPIKGNFDVRVGTGSSLPFARAEKQNAAMAYFKLGVIDDEELLKISEWPNWETVLERVKQKKMQQMQEQQQMAMAAQAQQGAPPQGAA
jgi:hypothetical protein